MVFNVTIHLLVFRGTLTGTFLAVTDNRKEEN